MPDADSPEGQRNPFGARIADEFIARNLEGPVPTVDLYLPFPAKFTQRLLRSNATCATDAQFVGGLAWCKEGTNVPKNLRGWVKEGDMQSRRNLGFVLWTSSVLVMLLISKADWNCARNYI